MSGRNLHCHLGVSRGHRDLNESSMMLSGSWRPRDGNLQTLLSTHGTQFAFETRMAEFHKVCGVKEIPEGEARMFVVNGSPVGVFHVDGEFFALKNECPHAGASLAHRFIDGDTVSCRIHHWRFCIRDGVYLDEVKPRYNARSFPARVIDDQVLIEV